ncbi:MAG: hypothetical protein AAF420_08420, partial [Pseudomonadota bacterium]
MEITNRSASRKALEGYLYDLFDTENDAAGPPSAPPPSLSPGSIDILLDSALPEVVEPLSSASVPLPAS